MALRILPFSQKRNTNHTALFRGFHVDLQSGHVDLHNGHVEIYSRRQLFLERILATWQ